MPIYEYKCRKCDKAFEISRSMTEADRNVTCPSCGSSETERTYSSVFAKTSRKS